MLHTICDTQQLHGQMKLYYDNDSLELEQDYPDKSDEEGNKLSKGIYPSAPLL